MKSPIDALLGGILLAAPAVLTAPARSTSLEFPGRNAPAFSESYLLTADPYPASPEPDAFRRLGQMGLLVVGPYMVRPGDTLASIANKFGSETIFIRSTNRLQSIYAPTGRRLIVHNGKGMLHQVREIKGRPETLEEIARREGTTPEEIVKANRLPGVALLAEDWLTPGSTLFIPNARLRFTDYLLPVDWMRGKRLVSSGFGRRWHPILRRWTHHDGYDLRQPYGNPVKATRDGVVIFCDWHGALGRLIIVRHKDGICTWYGHLSAFNVTAGQRVLAGQVIGKVGTTGLTTGPHLHFEVHDRYGKALNPKKFLF
jgi:murein DD-endopeptidase MepM/ murein hydrolase activator NlpD